MSNGMDPGNENTDMFFSQHRWTESVVLRREEKEPCANHRDRRRNASVRLFLQDESGPSNKMVRPFAILVGRETSWLRMEPISAPHLFVGEWCVPIFPLHLQDCTSPFALANFMRNVVCLYPRWKMNISIVMALYYKQASTSSVLDSYFVLSVQSLVRTLDFVLRLSKARLALIRGQPHTNTITEEYLVIYVECRVIFEYVDIQSNSHSYASNNDRRTK